MREADRDQQQSAPSLAAGIPVAGTPVAGTPVAGIPVAGIPVAGIPVAGIPAQRTPADRPYPPAEPFSPLAKAGVTAVILLALTWFFVSWLVLKSPLTDAIGETVGSLAVVLLIVSVIGAARS
jgi:hypothetical protein